MKFSKLETNQIKYFFDPLKILMTVIDTSTEFLFSDVLLPFDLLPRQTLFHKNCPGKNNNNPETAKSWLDSETT